MNWYKIAQTIRAYHGTMTLNIEWNISGAGQGFSQEGPGIYFTNDIEDAMSYAVLKPGKGTSTIFTVDLNLNKVVKISGKIPQKEIKQLLLWSMGINSEKDILKIEIEEFYESSISNWGEKPYPAFIKAFNDIINYSKNPNDAFQQVWIDHYRYKPIDYLQNMVKLGYDGIIIPRTNGVVHYIIFNPSVIKTISKQIVGEDEQLDINKGEKRVDINKDEKRENNNELV